MRKKTKRIKFKEIKKVYNVDSCEMWLKDNFFDLNWVEIRLLPDAASFGSIKGWAVPREMSLTHVFHLWCVSSVSAIMCFSCCLLKHHVFHPNPKRPAALACVSQNIDLYSSTGAAICAWKDINEQCFIFQFFIFINYLDYFIFCDNYSRFYRCSQKAKSVL